MGLFDYIKCEYPLPRPEMQDRVFQTKSTPNLFLDTYVITKEGKLRGPTYNPVWTTDSDSPLGILFKRENFEIRDEDFSGLLIFNDFETKGDYESPMIDFEALFDSGRVLWIRERGKK